MAAAGVNPYACDDDPFPLDSGGHLPLPAVVVSPADMGGDLLATLATGSDYSRCAVIVDYWRQLAHLEDKSTVQVLSGGAAGGPIHPSTSHRKSFSRKEIQRYISHVNQEEIERKQHLQNEIAFIQRHFRQRLCKDFCARHYEFKDKLFKALEAHGVKCTPKTMELCHCGLTRAYHSDDALKSEVAKWTAFDCTESVQPWNFGNLDIPGHSCYLELPGGTRKFIRMDDTRKSSEAHLYKLLTLHWGVRKPNMAISVTGGDISPLLENLKLHQAFRNGLIKTAVNTKAWILTDGLYHGSSREVGSIFQHDMKRTQWAEEISHAEIPLVGIAPWGVIASKEDLMGVYVGSTEARYNFSAPSTASGESCNALDPYHTVYILADDGTYGHYMAEPAIRIQLERYIKQATKIEMSSAPGTDVQTPVIILVVGGDRFTLKKVADAVNEATPVVIVNGSGSIATMLSDLHHSLCYTDISRENLETSRAALVQGYREKGLLSGKDDENNLRTIMTKLHLITVFGVGEQDESSLDTAILSVIFRAVSNISAQLNLTLAMSREDVAIERIFVEARKEELKDRRLLEEALLTALRANKAKFVELFVDQDINACLDLSRFLTMGVLHTLYRQLLNPEDVHGLTLVSLTKSDVYGSHRLEDPNLLPQVGRIIHRLMGNHYRLLYQERRFRQITDVTRDVPVAQKDENDWSLASDATEEAVWHLFLWAVLANYRDIAEHFLSKTTCKMGAALVACKMLKGLAVMADVWQEVELVTDLQENAKYFETLALRTLDNMYEMDRDCAYKSLIAVLPFHWGLNVNPLSIADDAECMRFPDGHACPRSLLRLIWYMDLDNAYWKLFPFMHIQFLGHSCPQSLLGLIWWRYMDQDNAYWKLFPVFSLLPFLNIPFISFDPENLSIVQKHDETDEAVRQVMQETEGFPTDKSPADRDEDQASETPKRSSGLRKRLLYSVWCTKNYYTAPVMKFMHGLVTYVIFLGIFSHFVLSVLKPYDEKEGVGVFEWLVYLWVFSIFLQEVNQLISRKSSGPLYRLSWRQECSGLWGATWRPHERMFFTLGIHRIQLWLADRWNKIDAIMLVMFIVSVVLRFTLEPLAFMVARFFFAVTLILFYVRLLRLGYISKQIGPRIITIRAMVADLLLFFLIMLTFILGFGIAFQAILLPNEPPSWTLVVDIIWRPYWQMFGELFIDDYGMGREVVNKACYTNYTVAVENGAEYCRDWLALVLLGVFMLITNIMLLNLLIAIFSNSFDIIEREALLIWRYHMYDLVHEYYQSSWLPPPLNILCLLANLTLWLLRWPRRWAYLIARHRHRNRIVADRMSRSTVIGAVEIKRIQKFIEPEAEEVLKNDFLYRVGFYLTDVSLELTLNTHFRQEEFMRDEDMEEKAYTRYTRMREKQAQQENSVSELLRAQNARLSSINSELGSLRQHTQMRHQPRLDKPRSFGHGGPSTRAPHGEASKPAADTKQGKAAHPHQSTATHTSTTHTSTTHAATTHTSEHLHNMEYHMKQLSSQMQQLQLAVDRQERQLGPLLAYIGDRRTRRLRKKASSMMSSDDQSKIDED